MRKRTLFFLIISGLLILCVTSLLYIDTSCATRSAKFLQEIEDIERRWYDGLVRAQDASPVSIEGPIADLEAIRNEAEALRPPECAVNVQISITTHMDYIITAYSMMMAGDPEQDIAFQFERAWEWEEYYIDDLYSVEND